MENDNMKKCPYCAEQIRVEAIKCRYCGSDLTKKGINFDFLKAPGYWHRVNEGKKIGGVCTGIARQLESPILIMPLRLFFIITTLFWGFGLLLYIILWLLMPPSTDTAAGPTPSGNSHRYGRTEKPAGGIAGNIQTEKYDSDIETEQSDSAVETGKSGTESETKESDGDIVTIEDTETVEEDWPGKYLMQTWIRPNSVNWLMQLSRISMRAGRNEERPRGTTVCVSTDGRR